MSTPDDPHSSYHTSIQIGLVALAAISSLISLFIPALYHIKKQCRQHPTSLISKISLLQALSNYNVILIAVNIYKFQSYVNIKNVFDLITFNQPDEPTDTEFCEINYGLYMILELSSIAYNIAFSIDLFITLKFPFYAGKKRMKFYNLFAILFLISTMPEAIIEAQGNKFAINLDICQNEYHNKAIYKVPIIFIVVLGIFYGLSFFIIIYSFIQEKHLGKVRAQYIRHHRFILLILISAWLFPLWTNILIYLGDQTSDQFYIVNLISFVSLLLLGALVNLVRFYHDTFLWERVKKMIFCEKTVKKKPSDDQKHLPQSDIWNLPLATAVAQLNNQRIVHSLIQVVTCACSDSQIDKVINLNNNNLQQTARSKSIVTFTAREKRILDHIHQNSSVVKNQHELLQNFIEKDVQNASLSEIKKISKKTKKFNMFCLNDKRETIEAQHHQKLKQKTVFVQEKFKKTQTANIESEIQRKRSRSDIRNHLSLHNEKDLSKIRNQHFLNHHTKTIDFSKDETYDQNNSQVYRSTKDNIQIKVVSHAHPIFSSIRKMNGLGEDEIEKSLDLERNVQQILKAKESLGASGSFFFFSFDHKLIIKTIGEGEDTVLLDLLPNYYFHLKKYKDTLLTKIYGLFSVQIAGISKITFILLQNSFHHMENENIIYKKYDMKGSTVSREVKDPKANVFKDMNYLKSNDAFIMMDADERERLISQIKADITMLKDQNIMDYSLLLGVGVKLKQTSQNSSSIFDNEQQIQRNNATQKQRKSQINFERDILKRKRQQIEKRLRVTPKKSQEYEKSWKYIDEYQELSGRVYSISIIDYLQQFNFSKFMQLQLKKLFKGGGDISSVDSDYYFFRFLNFVKKIIVPVTNFRKNKQIKEQQTQKPKQGHATMMEKQKKKIIYQIKLGDQWQDVYIKDD